jgi:hypothetical protein
MQTYEVKWTRCPTAYNPSYMLYVEAVDAEAAKVLARDHVKRRLGVGDWVKIEVFEYVAPDASLGRILDGAPR